MKYCAYLIPEASKYWNQKLDPSKIKNVEEKLRNNVEFSDQVSKWRRDYKLPKEKKPKLTRVVTGRILKAMSIRI